MPAKPILILVIGLTGAGKTTYCDDLSARDKGISFVIDRWMTALFWQDMPENPDINWFQINHDWYMERINRCENMIYNQAERLLRLGVNCILDLGFSDREHRKRYIQLGEQTGSTVQIHELKLSKKERWKRVELRNQGSSAQYSLKVDKDMFEYMESIFEPLGDDERVYLNSV